MRTLNGFTYFNQAILVGVPFKRCCTRLLVFNFFPSLLPRKFSGQEFVVADTALPIRASTLTEKPPLCSQPVRFSCLSVQQVARSGVGKIYTAHAKTLVRTRNENAPRIHDRIAAA